MENPTPSDHRDPSQYVPPENPDLVQEDDVEDDTEIFDKSKKRRIWFGIFIFVQTLIVGVISGICVFSYTWNEQFVLGFARLLGFLYALPVIYSFVVWMFCIFYNKCLPHINSFIILEAIRLVLGFAITIWVLIMGVYLVILSIGQAFFDPYYSRDPLIIVILQVLCGVAMAILPPVSYFFTSKYVIQVRKEDFIRVLKIGRRRYEDEQQNERLPMTTPRPAEGSDDGGDLLSSNEDAPLLV